MPHRHMTHWAAAMTAAGLLLLATGLRAGPLLIVVAAVAGPVAVVLLSRPSTVVRTRRAEDPWSWSP